jgi:hypothetical protein
MSVHIWTTQFRITECGSNLEEGRRSGGGGDDVCCKSLIEQFVAYFLWSEIIRSEIVGRMPHVIPRGVVIKK